MTLLLALSPFNVIFEEDPLCLLKANSPDQSLARPNSALSLYPRDHDPLCSIVRTQRPSSAHQYFLPLPVQGYQPAAHGQEKVFKNSPRNHRKLREFFLFERIGFWAFCPLSFFGIFVVFVLRRVFLLFAFHVR